MRIDSGLSSYYYQGRASYLKDDSDDTASDATSSNRSSRSQSPSISSSYLSSSLSSALWALEDSGEADTATAASATMSATQPSQRDVEQVEAFYLEYAEAQA